MLMLTKVYLFGVGCYARGVFGLGAFFFWPERSQAALVLLLGVELSRLGTLG